MTDRKQEEARIHDHLREESPFQRYSRETEELLRDNPLWSNLKFYSIERKSRRYVENWIQARCQGKKVLDYGCGNGEDTLFAARNGAEAVGIDISEVSIENCKKAAAAVELSDRAQFLVMDAENLNCEDNSFDLVVVYGVLHHLDFAAAMGEISRVLKPDGQAICTEALVHNALIRMYRNRTPHLRTPWEVQHIMRRENIVMAERWFKHVSSKTYHLATLAAVPFRNLPIFSSVLTALEAVDSVQLSLPWLRWQAWQVVFELSGPRKD